MAWGFSTSSKYARALVNLGKSCNNTRMDFIYAATPITCMAMFWHSPWLNGWKPKDIASAIFLISKRKNSTVRDALGDLAWIARIDMSNGLHQPISSSYTNLTDAITCNVTTKRVYSVASTYKVWFEGTPPKCKFFACISFLSSIDNSKR